MDKKLKAFYDGKKEKEETVRHIIGAGILKVTICIIVIAVIIGILIHKYLPKLWN